MKLNLDQTALQIVVGFMLLLSGCGGGGGGAIGDATIAISMAPPPAGVLDFPYAGFTFSVARGGLPPFTWAVTSGALPDGLVLASDGSLTGTPTTTGSFAFTLTATDSAPTPATNAAPFTIDVGDTPQLTISLDSPPTAIVGAVYPGFQFLAPGGLAPLVWSETGALPDLAVNLDGVLSGTPSSTGHFPITLEVKDALNRRASAPFTVRVALARPAAFTTTGSMSVARSGGHAATLLSDGRVLVTGGAESSTVLLASAELYDPSTGLFTLTGSMTVARTGHTATLLANGKVLVAGGLSVFGADELPNASVELYDPATGDFAATGDMAATRSGHTATMLNSGKVLVVGGAPIAELYDPATGTFSTTGDLLVHNSEGMTATLLQDGKVLKVDWDGTAELYDPSTETFSATGSMAVQPGFHSATRLQDGTVLVVGTESSELYDPATRTFTALDDASFAGVHTASLRADGTVLLLAGGTEPVPKLGWVNGKCVQTGTFIDTTTESALFAPEAQVLTDTGPLFQARAEHTATVLADGAVLVVGGWHQGTSYSGGFCSSVHVSYALSSAELFK